MASHRKVPGFTLVELLIVLAIIGVLLAIALPTIQKARVSAKSVACGSNLRQLYVAQNFYHDAYRRYTPVNHFNSVSASWVELLRPFIAPHSKGLGGAMGVTACPSPGNLIQGEYSYGLNTFTDLPNWSGKRNRRANQPDLILMADKGMSFADTLRTEEGFAFYYSTPILKWLYRFEQHSNHGAFRHLSKPVSIKAFQEDPEAARYNPSGLNALMADGHVQVLTRRELRLNSGRWMLDDVSVLPRIPYPGECCK